jgi:cystathionine beta-lyase/cystathionine gamma-synthase
MTHSTYSDEELREAGITEGMIRFSVGLENVVDLMADLNQALDKVKV